MKRIMIVFILLLGCVGQTKSYNLDESFEIARKFVIKSPTYKFDGEGLTHTGTKTLDCAGCWEFTFTFTSRSAGFGDRSDKMVAQVITEHTAVLTVEDGVVTRAVLDGEWDMINQEMIG